ncbi:hypothetical protein ACFXO9_27170 [Nocardia tengchongensis]|uniref:hypothetical protein n=1 Tax=Nocardia tengchongensis TaxID=2055889 RepID=UPI00364A2B62
MHSEHEEAMRFDFHDRVTLSWAAMWPGVTDVEAAEIDRRVSEYDQRWTQGPHAQEWEFLHAAYADWREQPDKMRKFTDDLDVHPGVWAAGGLTDLQRRSLDQARNIAHEERCAINELNPPAQRLPIRRDR